MTRHLCSLVPSVIAGVLIALAPGCAGNSTVPLVEVREPALPIERFGVSFRSPAGEGWMIADETGRDYATIHYVRRLTETELKQTPGRTLLVEVHIDTTEAKNRPKEFKSDHDALEHLRTVTLSGDPPGGRLHQTEFTSRYETFQGVEALRYHSVVEDHGVPGSVCRLETDGLACIVPSKPTKLVLITSSQRSRAGDVAPPLAPIGESFLRGVTFSKP